MKTRVGKRRTRRRKTRKQRGGYRTVTIQLKEPIPGKDIDNKSFNYYGETETEYIIEYEKGTGMSIPKESVESIVFSEPESITPCSVCGKVPKTTTEANLTVRLAEQMGRTNAARTARTFVEPGHVKLGATAVTDSLTTCNALHSVFGDISVLFHVTADQSVEQIVQPLQKLVGKKGQPTSVTIYAGLGQSMNTPLKLNSPSHLSVKLTMDALTAAGITVEPTIVPVCWAEVVPPVATASAGTGSKKPE